jgi:hypothetical protein
MIKSSLLIVYVATTYWKIKGEVYYKVVTILFGNPIVTIVSGPKKKKKHRKTIVTLGSLPRQGFAKVWAKNEPRSHISCSQECKKV